MDNATLFNELRQMINALANNKVDKFPPQLIKQYYAELKSDKVTIGEFEKFILLTAFRYFDDKKIVEGQRKKYNADSFITICNSLKRVLRDIKLLNAREQDVFLNQINQINRPEMRDDEIHNIIVNRRQIDETTWQKEFVEPSRLISALKWIQICADACAKKNMPKAGHRVANDDIKLLAHLIREFWDTKLERKFTCTFHFDKLAGKLEPLSDAAVFCMKLAAEIDPLITPRQMETAMKAAKASYRS